MYDSTRRSTRAVTVAGRFGLRSDEGTNVGAFAGIDWLTLAALSMTWGSSYLLIEIALRGFAPGVIVAGRLAGGAALLALLPGARTRIDPADRRRIALVAVLWQALPLLLFAYAQQWISSSLTGVMNAAAPILGAAVAVILLRRPPGVPQRVGLALGLGGMLLISLPSAVSGGSATALGIGLLLSAELLYSIAIALIVPLQQRYGAVALVLRVELISLAIAFPFAAAGLPASTFRLDSLLAMLILGPVNTGLGFYLMSRFVGRVGPIRGPVISYTIPVVALILGALVLDEKVALTTVLGLAVVLLATWLIGRRERPGTERAEAEEADV